MAVYVRLLRNFPEWNYQISFVKKTKTTTTPKIQIWYLLVPKWLDYKNNNKQQSTINHHQQRKKQTTPIISAKIFHLHQKKNPRNVRSPTCVAFEDFGRIPSFPPRTAPVALRSPHPSHPRHARPSQPGRHRGRSMSHFDGIHGTGILW